MPETAKRALSAAMARSHCATSWHPAAVARPLTAAMTGCGSEVIFCIIALHVANACVQPGEPVHLVFASRHGELARSAELLTQLAGGELPSPMSFSLSVLNAAAGLYGIARKDRSPATAVSSGEATFPLALVEGAAQALKNPDAAVVVAFADEPPPDVYKSLVDSPRSAHAIAVRLEAKQPQQNIQSPDLQRSGASRTRQLRRRAGQ